MGGIVWSSVASPMDFSMTFNALAALTSRGLTPFVVLSFFPSAVSSSSTLPPSSFENWQRLCATKRGDGMSGKLRRLYQQAVSPWGVASGGRTPEVK